jgi:hypothetical protein
MTAGQPCPLIWSAPLDEHAARFPDAAAARGRANQGVQRQRGRGAGRLPPGEAGLMARQRDWHGRDLANMAANLVTISDIAVRAGSPPDAAESWTGLPGFPCPLVPASEGSRVWWWPDVRGFIVSHGDELDGYVPRRPWPGHRGSAGRRLGRVPSRPSMCGRSGLCAPRSTTSGGCGTPQRRSPARYQVEQAPP